MHTLKHTKWAIFLGLAPALIIYICIAIFPIGLSVYYSLMNWDGITPMRFIGLDNFVDIFKDDIFGCPLRTTSLSCLPG